MPSPVVADNCITSICGLTRRASAMVARTSDSASCVKTYVRQKVDLVEDHEACRRKHVGILERLVLAFRHGKDGHLGLLAEVPEGRAHEVADVLDEQQGAGGMGLVMPVLMPVLMAVVMAIVVVRVVVPIRVDVASMVVVVPEQRAMQVGPGVGDHRRVEVAALARVDLDGRCACGADAVGVEAGFLITLDDANGDFGMMLAQALDGGAQQGGLARARA